MENYQAELDGQKAGRIQAIRDVLQQQRAAGRIKPQDFSTADRAAQQIIRNLADKHPGNGLFLYQMRKTELAVFQNPQDHVSEVQQAGAQVENEMNALSISPGATSPSEPPPPTSARAMTDGEKAGRVQGFRYCLADQKNSNEVTAADFKREDYAADSIITALRNQYDYTKLSPIFRQKLDAISNPIKNDCAGHAAELQQARADVEQEANSLAQANRQLTQPPKPDATTTSPGILQFLTGISKPGASSTRAGSTTGQTPHAPPPSRKSLPTNEVLAALVLLLAGAVAYFWFETHRQKPSSTAYSPVKAATLPAQPSPPPAEAPPPAQAPATKGSPAPAATAGLKDRLFAQQRDKYQSFYNDALDEQTAASAELAQQGPVLEGIQNNLQLLAKAVQHRLWALVTLRALDLRKLATDTILCKPLVRLFKRAGALLIILLLLAFGALLYGAYWLWTNFTIGLVDGIAMAAVPILVFFAIFFFIERHLQLKASLDALRGSADKFKHFYLAYIYDDQVAQANTGALAYHLIRVPSDNKQSSNEDFTLAPVSWGVNMRPDSFLLYVADIAVYRIERNGTLSLLFSNPTSPLVSRYGALLNQALFEQKSFASSTLDPLAAYGKAAWRKRKAAEVVPQLDRLVHDVDRVENVWRNTYVRDNVIDFLLKRIDSFNVRDSATPRGILLYGPAGNGKAHLAKKIAESIEARLDPINPATLNSADEVKKLWGRSRGGDPVVLFLDSAERVFPAPGSPNQGGGTRDATLAWIDEWGRFEAPVSRVWVVMSAESDKDLDPGILAKFGSSKIEILVPDEAGCAMILRQACRENQLPADLPAWLIKDARGLTVRGLREMVKEAKMESNAPDDAVWRKVLPGGNSKGPKLSEVILPAKIMDQLQAACRTLREGDRYKAKGYEVEAPNILLYGPPGTGKTQIARALAREAGGIGFVSATLADMKGQYVGESAPLVRKVFAKARAVAPCVLFIDEMETVGLSRTSPKADQFTHDIVNELLQQMNGVVGFDRPVFILGATNLKDEMDEAILSRFTVTIEIPLPDEAARREILKGMLRNRPLDPALDVDEVCAVLAKKTPRKSGRDLLMLVNRAIQRAITASTSADDVCLSRAILLAEFPEDKGESADPWAGLVLPPDILAQLKTATQILRDGDAYKAEGIDVPNILLFGEPGTGKTEIAKALAKAGGIGFISVTIPDMKGNHVGDSAGMVRQVFRRARAAAPAVLFIDEIDAVTAKRGSARADAFTDDIVEEMLQQMNGVVTYPDPVFILGATNLLQDIDPAILSRFTTKIEIPLPDEPSRCAILKRLIRSHRVDPAMDVDAVAAEIAKGTPRKAGRDLLMLVNRATQRAVAVAASPREVKLTRENLLAELAPKAKPVSEIQLEEVWAKIVLKPEIKESIKDKIRLFNEASKLAPSGLLLYGPSGTGKTDIARMIAQSTGSTFKSLKGSDLKAGYIGKTGQYVKDLWAEARGYDRCILFIDECDAVFASRTAIDTDTFTKDLVNEFIASWGGMDESGQVWVIGATNHRELLDDAILSRFGPAIEIGLPDAPQRLEILGLELKKYGFESAIIPSFVGQATTGRSGRDMSALAREACAMAGKGDITPEMWKAVVTRLGGEGKPPVDEDARWESLVLSDKLLKQLKSTCRALRQIDSIRKQGADPPRGILLWGKPGTGKTQIARTMANESGVGFINARPSDLKAGYEGQSGPKVQELFERARRHAPCILFIDEVDASFPRRGGEQAGHFNTDIVNTALAEMDGLTQNKGFVFLLAATNRPELVDDAILERFPDVIEIPYPDAPQRRQLLQILLAKKRVDFDVPQVAAELAGMTGNFSGRALRNLVDKATAAAMTRAFENEPESDEVNIIVSREDLISQLPPIPSPADAARSGLPAEA